jgi:hypothetical protein
MTELHKIMKTGCIIQLGPRGYIRLQRITWTGKSRRDKKTGIDRINMSDKIRQYHRTCRFCYCRIYKADEVCHDQQDKQDFTVPKAQ